jgi:hypothetical protein
VSVFTYTYLYIPSNKQFWPRMFYRSGWLRCVGFNYVVFCSGSCWWIDDWYFVLVSGEDDCKVFGSVLCWWMVEVLTLGVCVTIIISYHIILFSSSKLF